MGKRIRLNEGLIVVAVMFACSAAICERCNGEPPRAGRYTNSIGMELVRIEPGQFRMGFEGPDLPVELTEPGGTDPQGDYDEHPAHIVEITRPFYMSIYEVTNYQYELFDPSHKKYRGASKQDNSAVVNVNWYESQAFCQWLNDREELTTVGTRKGAWGPMVYRLPTEAEWEYACRAGTTTPFSTGDGFGPGFSEGAVQDLVVGRSPANAWGLYDMHGNVEEWCYDWYGPYPAGKQTNPVGPADGDFRVTRGGSDSTAAYYLRSANRMGTLPEDKHSLIGFRVVLAAMPPTEPWAPASPQRYQLDVSQKKPKIFRFRPDPKKPYFYGARKFMVMPASNRGPLYARHNHFISVVECPNGDLLAIWHTCIGESGRELNVAASRLRYGTDLWEPASLFWDAPDRNDHGHAMWYDGRDTIYHFQGLATQVRDVALVVRTSTDNGVTWSKPRIIADHGPSRMPVESVFSTKQG